MYKRIMVLALATVLLMAATESRAGVYAGWGALGSRVSVCFVGEPQLRKSRTEEIRLWIRDFEAVSAVRFVAVDNRADWSCPAGTTDASGNSVYRGDLRILIPGRVFNPDGPDMFTYLGKVAGYGCTLKNSPDVNNPGGSWGAVPRDPANTPRCMWNVKLGDDGLTTRGRPYRNHTLHEIGHALGLSHEHERYDTDANCRIGSGATQGLFTPYDKSSVMHYYFPRASYPRCFAADGVSEVMGNYADSGLSTWDALAISILYPPSLTFSQVVGKTTVRLAETIDLRTEWEARGALMANVAVETEWQLNGRTVARTPRLLVRATTVGLGIHTVSLRLADMLGRTFRYTGKIEVRR